jgi:hypothetical protein
MNLNVANHPPHSRQFGLSGTAEVSKTNGSRPRPSSANYSSTSRLSPLEWPQDSTSAAGLQDPSHTPQTIGLSGEERSRRCDSWPTPCHHLASSVHRVRCRFGGRVYYVPQVFRPAPLHTRPRLSPIYILLHGLYVFPLSVFVCEVYGRSIVLWRNVSKVV